MNQDVHPMRTLAFWLTLEKKGLIQRFHHHGSSKNNGAQCEKRYGGGCRASVHRFSCAKVIRHRAQYQKDD